MSLTEAAFTRLVQLLDGPRHMIVTGPHGSSVRALADHGHVAIGTLRRGRRVALVRLTPRGRAQAIDGLRLRCGLATIPAPSLTATHPAPLDADERDLRAERASRPADDLDDLDDLGPAPVPTGWAGQAVNPYGELGEP